MQQYWRLNSFAKTAARLARQPQSETIRSAQLTEAAVALKRSDEAVIGMRRATSVDRQTLLTYESRYTQRVAIANRRLIVLDEAGVTFRYRDYRRDGGA